MPDTKTSSDQLATTIQTVSVVVGIVISVLSFNDTRVKEADARELEAAKPFYTLRQNLYTDALRQAAILSNPEVHTKEEVAKARARFRELYVAELSMVEAPQVEKQMVALAREIDPALLSMNDAQTATYNLAHALRDTFSDSWKVKN